MYNYVVSQNILSNKKEFKCTSPLTYVNACLQLEAYALLTAYESTIVHGMQICVAFAIPFKQRNSASIILTLRILF